MKKKEIFFFSSLKKKSQPSWREEKKGREVDAPHKEKKMCCETTRRLKANAGNQPDFDIPSHWKRLRTE